MNITELIEYLTECKKSEGDLPVAIHSISEDGEKYDVAEIHHVSVLSGQFSIVV